DLVPPRCHHVRIPRRRRERRDGNRAVVLLAGVEPVREAVVDVDVVQLRGRLVELCAPCLPTIARAVRAAAVALHHEAVVVRIDPQIWLSTCGVGRRWKVFPPSVERQNVTLLTYTTSGSIGSAVIRV